MAWLNGSHEYGHEGALANENMANETLNARVQVIALLAVTRWLIPLQTSSSRCLLWCFHRNRVKKSRSPHSGCSHGQIPLHYSRPRQLYALVTSFNNRQVHIHANHSAGPSKWEHLARSARGCRCNTFPPIFSMY